MCIDFNSRTTVGHQEKSGEIKGKQEKVLKAQSKELSSNWKGKGLSALPV